ncbi:hypothetical protein [Bacillus sp. OAE603]|uniref:hypothetical protein n=1 Tax=Gottfriedia sp. OAE603 TaxID=2663872 RepID=UPI00178B1B22
MLELASYRYEETMVLNGLDIKVIITKQPFAEKYFAIAYYKNDEKSESIFFQTATSSFKGNAKNKAIRSLIDLTPFQELI